MKYLKTMILILNSMLFIFFLMCSSQKREEVASVTAKSFPVQEGWNSKLFITKLGRTQAIVQYGHMAQYENQDIIQLNEGVEVDFFDHDGIHTSHLTSDSGSYNQQNQFVTAKGRVIAVSDSGVTLRTATLAWDNNLGKIRSDTLVQVTTQEGDTLWGQGFESHADLSHWVIKKPWGVSEKRLELAFLDSAFFRKPTPPIEKSDSLEQNKVTE